MNLLRVYRPGLLSVLCETSSSKTVALLAKFSLCAGVWMTNKVHICLFACEQADATILWQVQCCSSVRHHHYFIFYFIILNGYIVHDMNNRSVYSDQLQCTIIIIVVDLIWYKIASRRLPVVCMWIWTQTCCCCTGKFCSSRHWGELQKGGFTV